VLVDHFLERISGTKDIRYIVSLKPAAEFIYDWPGNVRELENCWNGGSHDAGGAVLNAADLPAQIRASSTLRSHRRQARPIVPLAEVEKQTILEAWSTQWRQTHDRQVSESAKHPLPPTKEYGIREQWVAGAGRRR